MQTHSLLTQTLLILSCK